MIAMHEQGNVFEAGPIQFDGAGEFPFYTSIKDLADIRVLLQFLSGLW